MTKYSPSGAANADYDSALIEISRFLAQVKQPGPRQELLGEWLSRAEVVMLAKRLQIAARLLRGQTYAAIKRELKVQNSTIARISESLQRNNDSQLRRLLGAKKAKRRRSEKIKPLPYSFGTSSTDFLHG